MKELDSLDKKILYELGDDARLSYKELSKRIKSKKTVVSYRIQNLMKDKIIWKFVPVFSIDRLGLQGYKIYLKFNGLDKEKKESMIKGLMENKNINWVAESMGAWDLMWSTISPRISEFAKEKNDFFKKYGKYIQEYSFNVLEDALVFNRDYMVDKKIDYRKKFVFSEADKEIKIDEAQKRIINLIRNDGRFQITKIADELDLHVRTVMSKISDLEKKKIIQGYTTFLDVNKIGLKFFKLCLYLQDFTGENYKKLLNFCMGKKNIIHIIKSIGSWDLELEAEAENFEYVYSLIEEIKTNFPKMVKKIDVVIITKEHKLDFLPKL